ncbi:MAG: hypothetical protein LBE57_03980 [Methanosarcinales archaeon]|jgi:hypothetical protein|nr:hypothetical protein [Methanosarcinales archaeon]
MSILFYAFILTIPALYAAVYKDLFTVTNQKMNTYLLRLFYLTPFCFFVGCMAAPFTSVTVKLIFPDLMMYSMEILGEIGGWTIEAMGDWTVGAIINLPFLLILTKVMITPDKSEKAYKDKYKNEEFDYYVFLPQEKAAGGKKQGTKYIYNKNRKSNELRIGTQTGDLILLSTHGHEKEIIFTTWGEIAADKHVFQVFEEESLTGFYKKRMNMKYMEPNPKQKGIWLIISELYKHIKAEESNTFEKEYHQLMTAKTLNSMSSKMTFKFRKGFFSRSLLPKNKIIYYDKETMENASDFNRSKEHIGSETESPYAPHQYWVISKKAHSVLKERFYFVDADFMPVVLIDSENKGDWTAQ